MWAELWLVLDEFASLGVLLTSRAPFHARNCLYPFSRNRRAANLAEHGGLPLGGFEVVGRRCRYSLLFANRTCHSRRCFKEQRGNKFIVGIRFAP